MLNRFSRFNRTRAVPGRRSKRGHLVLALSEVMCMGCLCAGMLAVKLLVDDC